MYESPIDIIYSDMQMKLENEVCKAVQNVGINVNKDELIKALSYDRQQYEKGYADAKAEQQWIPVTERLPKKPDNYPKCEIRRTYYLVSLASRCVKSLGYDFDRDEWMITGSPVTAWMPLPMPWEGGDADGNT